MPIHNAFRHQAYSDRPPQTPFEVRQALAVEWDDDARASAQQALQRAQIQKILLMHGTFVGDDALGLVRTLDQFVPDAGGRIRELNRDWVDRLVGDVGNYSQEFVQELHSLIDTDEPRVAIDHLTWSGENHHVGRADAAVLLLDRLLDDAQSGCSRFLLWGHSHAGNVFALVTNLLRGAEADVRRFFAACRVLFSSQQVSEADRKRWDRVHQRLSQCEELVSQIQLDIVTFGTPIRYGWETRGYRRLLHIVNHRPADDYPEFRAPFPIDWDDAWSARFGDYIQQLGIAGTDFLPSVFTWRAFRVEQRLNRLLQKGLHRSGTWDRLKLGMRVPHEGRCLLIDYPDDKTNGREHLFGHGIYTTVQWLPFHLREVLTRFYAAG